MRIFDSLTHITQDGSWLGERRHDASLRTLLQQMDDNGVYRACLVGIADYVDNEVILESARAHPDRFVPIAGLNPRALPTIRRVEARVAELVSQGFAGIKLHPRLNGFDALDPKSLAVFEVAVDHGLVIRLDTLFRRRGLATRNAPDNIDFIANACPETRILLLHAAGPSMLELFEIVRANPNLMLDFSFSIMRYAGSRLDQDMRYFFETTDQLATIGSDFPEYPLDAVVRRFQELIRGVDEQRLANITDRNPERLFASPSMARGVGTETGTRGGRP